jgi:pre-rRNA-processing protein TSR3
MGSSASTRSRSAEPAPGLANGLALYLVHAGEDHPRACTGRRLVRAGWAREIDARARPGFSPVVLDPYAPQPLSASDRDLARARGLLGVDCSWNRLSGRGRYPETIRWLDRLPRRRRLPLLRAANPQHYGRPSELTTAEAFGASLALLGEPDRASRLLDGFAGGSAFLDLNRSLLERYIACPNADEILRAERTSF